MQCINPFGVRDDQGLLYVPCGKCRMCKIAKAREWAVRIGHETTSHQESVFVTLTYADEFLPLTLSLDKRILQLYFKRLRKALEPRRIRYFASGEYGEANGRPHYHAIVFGVSLSEHELELIRDGDQSRGWKVLKGPLKDAWKDVDSGYYLGFVSVGSVTYNSARYCVDYCQKSFDDPYNKKEYGHLCPPFQIQSRGLGKEWALENAKQILRDCSVRVRGKEIGVPKYYQSLIFDTEEKKQKLRDKAAEKEEEGRHYWRKKGVDEYSISERMRQGRLHHARTQFARVDLKRKKGV